MHSIQARKSGAPNLRGAALRLCKPNRHYIALSPSPESGETHKENNQNFFRIVKIFFPSVREYSTASMLFLTI